MTACTALPPIDALQLRGTPRDIGRAHGEARRHGLQRWRDDRFFRIARAGQGADTPQALLAQARPYHAAIAAACPDLVEEIAGVAEGAGLAYEELLALQLRRELVGYTRFPARGDCSLAAVRGARPFLAQTVDLAGHMAEFAQVLHITPRHGPPVLMFCFAGMLGYLGVNAHGLAVGINLVLGGRWGLGLPAYLLVRRLLACASAAQALALAMQVPHASSRALTLMDRHELLTLEYTPERAHVVRQARELLHTNHFLHPEMQADESINPFALSGSRRRLQALQARLAQVDPAGGAPALVADLFGHPAQAPTPLCVHSASDPWVEATAGAVCIRPAEGRLAACRGTPCTGEVREFLL